VKRRRAPSPRAAIRRRTRARPNPGRAANQPREVRASARHASLAMVLFARTWTAAARDAQQRGRLDAGFFVPVRLMTAEIEDFFSPSHPAAKSPMGHGGDFRAALHRDADTLPFWAFLARVASHLEARAAQTSGEGWLADALARREFAAWLRKGKAPAWMAPGAMSAWSTGAR
jgi:hypothetical protein